MARSAQSATQEQVRFQKNRESDQSDVQGAKVVREGIGLVYLIEVGGEAGRFDF